MATLWVPSSTSRSLVLSSARPLQLASCRSNFRFCSSSRLEGIVYMGENYVHFYGGSPLNRLSWLRSNATFVSAALQSSQTRCIVFKAGEPLVSVQAEGGVKALAKLPTDVLRPVLGQEPFFGQGQNAGEHAPEGTKTLESARVRGPNLVFLGVQEPDRDASLPSTEFQTPTRAQDIHGTPYFALDATDISLEDLASHVSHPHKLEFAEPRSATAKWPSFDAGLFSLGRTMTDWLGRRKFCPACGSRTYTLWAGWKLGCSSLLPWTDNGDKPPCPSSIGLNNYTHPRTDCVVITAVLDETGDRILLGRNKKFPSAFYSALAGFLEPGESFEDAVKREIWEESGVRVRAIRYHSGQPWPYPANLMIGCYAIADSSQPIRTDLDNELEDAKWFTRNEVLAVLAHPEGTNIRRREYKNFDEAQDQSTKVAAIASHQHGPEDLPAFRVPPQSAIAGVLISQWARGEVHGLGGGTGALQSEFKL